MKKATVYLLIYLVFIFPLSGALVNEVRAGDGAAMPQVCSVAKEADCTHGDACPMKKEKRPGLARDSSAPSIEAYFACHSGGQSAETFLTANDFHFLTQAAIFPGLSTAVSDVLAPDTRCSLDPFLNIPHKPPAYL